MLQTRSGFLFAFIWLTFITVFMLLPGDDLPKEDWLDAIHADKLVHIIFFAVLVYLFYQPFTNKKGKWLLVIATSAFVYGVAIEFIQERWAVNRSFDIGDIAADATGCLASCFYSILMARKNSNKVNTNKIKK